MRDIAKTLLALVLIALVLAIVLPFGIMGFRVVETWTRNETQSLLGGALAICGGGATILAVMAGAGAFARLAGWKPPRRDVEQTPPVILNAPPGWDEQPQLPPPTAAFPPWGMTGGGQFELLPPPQQDRRFTVTTDKEVMKQ